MSRMTIEESEVEQYWETTITPNFSNKDLWYCDSCKAELYINVNPERCPHCLAFIT